MEKPRLELLDDWDHPIDTPRQLNEPQKWVWNLGKWSAYKRIITCSICKSWTYFLPSWGSAEWRVLSCYQTISMKTDQFIDYTSMCRCRWFAMKILNFRGKHVGLPQDTVYQHYRLLLWFHVRDVFVVVVVVGGGGGGGGENMNSWLKPPQEPPLLWFQDL